MIKAQKLIDVFNGCFLSEYNTQLVGGADEPLYVPANNSSPAILYFRFDYASSALHEISHWCLAGHERRLLEDYGYWYIPDSRNELSQQEFEKVEVKPQAVECILHWCAGMLFRVSADNLSLPDYDVTPFETAVLNQVKKYLEKGIPDRAETFAKCLLQLQESELSFDEYLVQQYENCSR